MVQATAVSTASADTSDLKARFLTAFRWMLLARVVEEKLAALYRGGKITGGVFLGKGQEALSVATAMALRKGDVFAPLIRDQAGRLAFGETLLDCTRTYMGSRLGPMRGRDGNVHRGRPKEGLMAMISHLGAMLPVVAGTLLARRFRGVEGTVGAVNLGDGATSTGAFHEGLNLAAVEKLPLVLVVANNQYAYSTPTSRQFACEDLVDKAVGYGVAGHSVDGTNLEACLDVLDRAVTAARTGGGPQLVIASLLRLVGHGEHDDAGYVDPALRKSPLGADCLELAEQRLLHENWTTSSALHEMQQDAQRQVEEAVATTLREPLPDPDTEDWCPLATRHLCEGGYSPT
ncbi:dehydrogenase E1 component [Chthoniobacter flavus Ellin428]|uniref:Dehydrogenase E1 component n=1 Tax=Chthoniobacter flavus Ellin428 TaxID=497964 RepID=B4DC32_9BACT|nr:thiamine pyrophosphate-dependent dehydrogenase E1 component subunit alpha [Chthoniobacter flavus]EDY16006.1 dehydrogenase E1 component [Chthoniobacter flavus Ellin428]TCO85264.1 pyruvate dehydrogenase E1 component alpha subunit/2-oxoisovalerate dehydrogenase E1 component alpha subunit [Chthoniobacter flavus]